MSTFDFQEAILHHKSEIESKEHGAICDRDDAEQQAKQFYELERMGVFQRITEAMNIREEYYARAVNNKACDNF